MKTYIYDNISLNSSFRNSL